MMKPPVAAGKLVPCVATSSAAPGVDHAVSTGWRYQSDRPMLVTPMPMPSAHSHDVICAGDAPSACAPWKMMATELVKPTSTAMKPATMAERETSLNMAARVPDRGRPARFVGQAEGPA